MIMERSSRPASESYQSVCCSITQSLSSTSETGILEDDDDRAPIFSLSKSSVDVMATGHVHKRDLTWARLDLKRSSSTNTHSEQNQPTLQQLRHHHKWRHNSHQFSLTTQNEDLLSPPPLSERWISNMHRWSGCSGGTHSRSSTPDTVVWKGGSSRPSSVNQESVSCSTPDSPMSKLTTTPPTPSPFISPFHSPTLPPENLLNSSSSSAASLSVLRTPQPAEATPQPPSTSTVGDEFPDKLFFQFPSPVTSCVTLAEECSGPGHLDDEVKEPLSPKDTQLLHEEETKSVMEVSGEPSSSSPTELNEISSCGHCQSPWQMEQNCRAWKAPLVCSLSDSLLHDISKRNLTPWRGTAKCTELLMVDAAVQTVSPFGSCCDLQRNKTGSNTESLSLLGSPPGSRLNLKSPVGSHSNLVSASSSMFPVSSGDEEVEKRKENLEWDETSASSNHLERRRSCLKIQAEEQDRMGRRGSMKQVQWDEDGLTWEIHGASLDPEELSNAIQKHLELKNSPQPQRRLSNKKKAPMPPLISNMVMTMDPDMSPPVMSIKCMVEGVSQDTLEAVAGGGVQPGKEGKTMNKEEVKNKRSRAKHGDTKEIEELMSVEEGNPSLKSQPIVKKKTVIRSLRRPGWCGGSRKKDD